MLDSFKVCGVATHVYMICNKTKIYQNWKNYVQLEKNTNQMKFDFDGKNLGNNSKWI